MSGIDPEVATELLHAYLFEASQDPSPGQLRTALLRWSSAMDNPLFVLDTRIDRSEPVCRVKRSDCAPLEDESWDSFLSTERSWTHLHLWTTTSGDPVVSLETGRAIDRAPAGWVQTGHVHTEGVVEIVTMGDETELLASVMRKLLARETTYIAVYEDSATIDGRATSLTPAEVSAVERVRRSRS
jgi:hypothetical protein